MFQIVKDIELVRFQNQLISDNSFKIEVLDDSKLTKAIVLGIHHCILNQKKLLIVLPDQYDFVELSRELISLGILEHSLFVGQKQDNKLNDISTLHKANIPIGCLDDQSLSLFKQDYSSLLTELDSDYSALLDKTIFNASIADLVEIRNHNAQDRTVQEISTLFNTHNLHDFKVLYSKVINAGTHHDESHALQTNAIAIKYFTEQAHDDHEQLSSNISIQILSAESLIDQIDHLMQDQFESIYSNASSILINTIQKVSIIKEQFLIDEAVSRPAKKTFFSRKQEFKSPTMTFEAELSELVDILHNNEVLNKTIDFDLFNDALEKDKLHKLTNYLKSIKIDESIIRSIISRTNISQIANDPNHRLIAIEDSLNMYQEDSVLEEQPRTGGFTLNHKKQALKHDLDALKQARLSFMINPKLFNWYNLYYQLSTLEKSVVDTLLYTNYQDWSKILQSAYIEFMLNKSRTLFSHLNSKRFESALRLERLIQDEEYKNAKNKIAAYRQSVKNDQLTNKNPFLDALKESKSNIESVDDLFNEHLSSLIEYFQTCIVNKSKYIEDAILFNKSKDLIMNLAPSLHIDEGDSQMISLNINQNKTDSTLEDPQLFDSNEFVRLLLPYPKGINAATGETFKRNISWARNLSTNIFALHSKYRIYQTKHLGIISFWSEHKDKALQQLAGTHAIKEISFSGENGMVETLLDETKQTIFLFQDGLINPKYPKLYHWQFHLIQLLKSANIACYNIWSSDYLKHGSLLIKSIAEEIDLKPNIDSSSQQYDKTEVVENENSQSTNV